MVEVDHRVAVVAALAWLALGGCGGEEGAGAVVEQSSQEEEALGCDGGQPQVLVVRELRFGREEPAGVTPGMDLDGVSSDGSDAQGCFKPDMVDAEGNPGIDNQFARILPGLEAVGGEAIEGIVQGAINSGELLVMFEMAGLDDRHQDSCTGVTIQQGLGTPEVGTDGRLVPHQTFDVDPDAPSSHIADGFVEGGELVASGFDFTLPIFVFGFDLEFNIRGATLKARWQRDGTVRGFIAGAVSVDEVIELTEGIEGGGQVASLVLAVLRPSADLFPDEQGDCTHFSLTLTFEAAPAFFFQN